MKRAFRVCDARMNALCMAISMTGILCVGCPSPTAPEERAAAPVEEAGGLPRPMHLPQAAHAVLRSRMHRHGDDAVQMFRAVLYLDYATVAELSKRVAEEPRLARPSGQDPDLLNTHLPKRFFEIQDLLVERARALTDAASAEDSEKTSEAFGRLVETCVRCHGSYLSEKAEEPAIENEPNVE